MKELRCADAGFACDAVVQAETVEELMAQAVPHAREAHGIDVTPPLQQQLAGLVRDV